MSDIDAMDLIYAGAIVIGIAAVVTLLTAAVAGLTERVSARTEQAVMTTVASWCLIGISMIITGSILLVVR